MNENECREIYREAFGDDGAFEDRLFSLCGEYCRTVMCEGKTAALLFALPCKIITLTELFDAYYLYAAATKKIYRGKGYMSGLIRDLIKEGKPIFLNPASEELISFYKRLGFECFTAVTGGNTEKIALPIGGFSKLSSTEPRGAKPIYTAMCVGSPVRLDGLCFPYIME